MARAVVLGADGFIGSRLSLALAAAGHEVTAFDRFSLGADRLVSVGVRALQGDFLSRSDLESAVRDQELVFHFVSTTSPVTAEGDPTLDLRTNVSQSVELLEACVAAGVRHVYFASTGGAIYGDQGKPSYAESDRTVPISPYGIGKLAVERYLDFFHAKYGLSSTTLRISNPYGPGQRTNRRQGLIPIALRRIEAGDPVVRLGDGSMVRDYVYIDDAVRMIVSMVGAQPSHAVYNIGSGIGVTVDAVLAAIRSALGRDFAVIDEVAPASFVRSSVLDMSRYRAEFPEVGLTSLEAGIRQTWEEVAGGAQ